MAILTFNEALKKNAVGASEVKSLGLSIPEIKTPDKSFGQKTKEFGVGLLKGASATAQGFQDLGQRVLAGVDPTQNLEQVRQSTGLNTLKQDFKAEGGYEKGGKALEFIAELLLTPTGIGSRLANTKTLKSTQGIFEGIGSKLSNIPDDLVEGGVKVKDKVADILVNLDAKTKTALDRTTPDVFQKFVEQGRKAVVDDRVRTPLETVGDNIIDSLGKLKSQATEIGEKKSQYLKYPDAFTGDGIKVIKGKLQSFLNSRSMIENDKSIVKKMVSEFNKLGQTPSKGQVDKFIDFAQETLYAGEKNLVQPTSNKTSAQLKSLISELNTNLKKQLPKEYGVLNDKYSELKRLMSEINTRLGKEGASAGSFVKRIFSPSDARTKELFEQLEKLTGQDFSRDARLAKFVMEALGDTRASSILEQIPTSAKGMIDKSLEFVSKKLSDPIKAGERYIKKN
jgi:hypothetical protein